MPVIAVDGPAAAGKGSLSRHLAAEFGLPHLDTGMLYRIVALDLLNAGQAGTDAEAAVPAAASRPRATSAATNGFARTCANAWRMTTALKCRTSRSRSATAWSR